MNFRHNNQLMYINTHFQDPHIFGSASWPKKKNFQYHLSVVIVDQIYYFSFVLTVLKKSWMVFCSWVKMNL